MSVDTGLAAYVRAHLPPPPARILEVGAGNGELANLLRENGYDVTVSGTEKMLGADVSVDAGPLRLRTEGLVRRVDYEPGKRGGSPDSWYSNGYVLAAYQLPWAGIEPFAYFEAIHFASSLGDTVLLPSAGVNVHFNPNVQLKTQ